MTEENTDKYAEYLKELYKHAVPWHDRRMDFNKYINESLNPSTPKRKKLLKDLVSEAKKVDSFLIRFLLPNKETYFREYNNDIKDGKFFAARNESIKRFPKYFEKSYSELLYYMDPTYYEYARRQKLREFIKKTLLDSQLPKKLQTKLEKEYLNLHHFFRLLFMYFGDILEKAPLQAFLNMATDFRTGFIREFTYETLYGLFFARDLDWLLNEFDRLCLSYTNSIRVKDYSVHLVRKTTDKVTISLGFVVCKNYKPILTFSRFGGLINIYGKIIKEVTREELYAILADLTLVSDNLHKQKEVLAPSLKDETPDLFSNMGLIYWGHGDYNESITEFNKAVNLNPQYVPVYRYRGDSYLNLKEYGKAIDDFTKAIELDPRDTANVYLSRGICYASQKNYEQGIKDIAKAIEINPKDANAYYNRGLAYAKAGSHGKAIDDFTRSIELDSQRADTYNDRGICYKCINEHEKALDDYARAIQLDPNNPSAYLNRGNCYYDLKQYEKAIEEYTKAIELDKNYSEAWYGRGLIHSIQEKYKEAIEDFTKAIELNPDYTDAYNERAFSFYSLKEYDKAIQDFTKSIELDPENSYTYSNRAEVYFNQGKYQLAFEDCEKAIELDPNNEDAQKFKDLSYKKLGRDTKKAIVNEKLVDAVINVDFEGVKKAIKEGADVNLKIHTSPLLNSAVYRSSFKIIKYLVEKGADVNCMGSNPEWSPLMIAAFWGKLEVVKYLIEKGADANTKGEHGKVTALDLAPNIKAFKNGKEVVYSVNKDGEVSRWASIELISVLKEAMKKKK